VIFIPTALDGASLIELTPAGDERGFFARAFCRREFEAHGLNPNLAQCNLSFNKSRGTLRGMHYQLAPHAEVKLIRCTRGAIYDVIVDLRPQSRTFKQWMGVELTSNNHAMLYVPEGFAHGYLTLEENTEVFYQVSEFYSKEYERGVRWNDAAFGIEWPIEPAIISDKDRRHADFEL
jgi:dTDP-4-dehydrorhamnose 3,5-epimerase